MAERIRVGVIGAGFIGLHHLEVYSNTPSAELVAVCDIDEKRAREAGDKFRIEKVFLDYEEMLQLEDLDAVSICLPNSLHPPATISALKAGKHVLCEKPLSTDSKSAEEMVDTAHKTGKRLAISLNLRHTGNAQMLKKAADSGKMGRIYYGKGAIIRRNAIPKGWFHRKKYAGGGPLYDLASHILDVTWWIMGKPKPVAAFGATYAVFGPRGLGMGDWGVGYADGPFDVEDLAVGMVRFQGGQSIFVETSWAVNLRPITYCYVCGTEGGGSLYPEYEIFDTKGEPIAMEPLSDQEPAARFVEDLAEDRPFVGPGEDGVVVMKMLEAIYRSAEAGEEVRIS